MNTKLCSRCGEDKSIENFNKNKLKQDGLQTCCRICQNNGDKIWYSKNRNNRIKSKNKRNHEIRQWFNELRDTFKCENCPEKDSACLDFHHTRDKDIEVSTMVFRGFSKENILKEIKKCKILCSNCHRKLHSKIR